MTDTLLFLHLLSAAVLVAGLMGFTAIALGARMELAAVRAFYVVWNVGATGVFLFGVALAIDIDGYEVWDAWVLLALGLWLAAGFTGERVPRAYRAATEQGGGQGVRGITPGVARFHWITVVLIVLLLADMVWKPWA